MNGEVPRSPSADGRRARWDAHRAARREELIAAAVRSVARHGADVGMGQIAADASTSKPVIYRYFVDKTDLHRAVTQHVVGTIIASLREVTAQDVAPRELIARSVAAYLTLLEEAPELCRFVVRHPQLPAPADAPVSFGDVIADLLAEQLAAQLGAAGREPDFAHPWAEAIVGFISAASLWWLDHCDAMTREQLGDHLTALLWGGAAQALGTSGGAAQALGASG